MAEISGALRDVPASLPSDDGCTHFSTDVYTFVDAQINIELVPHMLMHISMQMSMLMSVHVFMYLSLHMSIHMSLPRRGGLVECFADGGNRARGRL